MDILVRARKEEEENICLSVMSDDSLSIYDRLTNVDRYSKQRGLWIIQKHCQKKRTIEEEGHNIILFLFSFLSSSSEWHFAFAEICSLSFLSNDMSFPVY